MSPREEAGAGASPESLPDAERVALDALDAGDLKTALTVLMDAYGTPVYRFCRFMVTDPDLAEDAHQMTFVQAYESLGRFSRRSTLRTWLFSIARHRCLDAVKVAGRRKARFEAVAETPEERLDEPAADERLVQRARREALAGCLDELRPEVRTAVLLRFQEELSYPEIARVSGDQAATLQARVARALPVLRTCLERKGES